MAGEGQAVIIGAGEPDGASGAAQTPKRDPGGPRPHAEQIDEMGIQGWGRVTGGGDENDLIHFIGPTTGPVETGAGSFGDQGETILLIDAGAFRLTVRLLIPRQRH